MCMTYCLHHHPDIHLSLFALVSSPSPKGKHCQAWKGVDCPKYECTSVSFPICKMSGSSS